MKRILLLVAALAGLSTLNLSAETLTPDEALARIGSAAGPNKVRAIQSARLVHTVVDNRTLTPGCYVFNTPSEGYLIVSADDVATPLLGYSDEGSFDAQNIPDNLAYWLESYANEIAAASEQETLDVTGYQPLAQTRPNRGAIMPLCKTKWDQTEPYNLKCPTSGSNRTVAGCTAIAMAQVMKYHQWPQGPGTGSKSYRWGTKTISFNYGATTFDWANMLDTYPAGANSLDDKANDAVATLVYACGIACDCAYGVESTGGSQNHGVEVLKENLGYAKDARAVYRSLYSLLDWEQLVYDQLATYGPVWYTGYNQTYDAAAGAGHSFVCDGYSKDGYFHINWGWAGLADGYFRMSALEPENQGTGGSSSGYNFNQNIIINLCPDRGQSVKPFVGMFLDGDFTLPTNSLTLGTSLTYYPRAWSNSTDVIDKLYGGLRFVDAAGNETLALMSTAYGGVKPNFGFAGQNAIKVTLPYSLEDGTYLVYPGFKDDSDGQWHDFQAAMNYISYQIAVVHDGLIKFSSPSPSLPAASAPELLSAVFSNKFFEATLTLTNPNPDEYFGSVVLGLLDNAKTTVVSTAEYNPVNLLPGESVNLHYLSKFKDVATGSYQLAVLGLYNNKYYILSNTTPVTIAPTPTGEFKYTFTTPEVKGEANGTDGIVRTSFTITGTQGAEDIYVGLQFARSMFASAFKQQFQFDIPISEGYSRDIHFEVPIDNVNTTSNFYIRYFIRCNGEWKQFASRSFRFTVAGIEEITSDCDEIISIETYDIQGRLVDNDNLAPGTYIRVLTKADGTTETLKIAK